MGCIELILLIAVLFVAPTTLNLSKINVRMVDVLL